MKKTEKISVIVPIYNVEKYLNRCIDSIINQTYENLEIILVDDGSPDDCGKICDEYAKLDKRIKVIHKKNGGLSDARNAGIDVSKGKYLTFIDSDDYIDLDYVEFLYNLIKKFKTKMSICIERIYYENGTILSKENDREVVLNQKEVLEKMLYQDEINVSTWAKMYDRSLFKKIKFPKGKIFEDAFTTYKLVMECDKVAVNVKCKYNYMIRKGSILTADFNLNKLLLIDAYQQMTRDVLKIYPDLDLACKRANIYSRLSTLRQMIYTKNRLKNKEQEIREYIINNSKEVLKNKKVCFRDKIAIIILKFGIFPFKIAWKIYCFFTGRMYL